MKLSDVKIDPIKMEQGAWVDNIPELEGVSFKVRGANNKDYRKLQNRMINAVPRKKRVGGQLDPADQDRIMSIVLRDTCLLDWKGIEDDAGKSIAFSKELATEYLTDPQYSKIREGVAWAANVVAEQQDAVIEDDVKN